MSGVVFRSAAAHALKATLSKVIADKTDGVESKCVCYKWMQQMSMKDAWEHDLDVAGPGLAAETDEGTEILTGTMQEGNLWAYYAKKFALKIGVTKELMEDKKYDKVVQAAQKLKRAIYKSLDYDTVMILVRMANASYPGGDGVPLISASHPLTNGGTWSNTLATPAAPSKTSISVARAQVMKYPGQDGLTEGFDLDTAVYPTEQWNLWEELTGSKFTPTLTNFAEVNVVNRLGLKLVPHKYWSNTTTNWVILTDAPDKINLRWRRRIGSNTWVENSQEIMWYSVAGRWAHGWSDPRCIVGSTV